MKVVFLDFDGVLNSAEYRRSVDDYHSNFIDESKLRFLSATWEQRFFTICLSRGLTQRKQIAWFNKLHE